MNHNSDELTALRVSLCVIKIFLLTILEVSCYIIVMNFLCPVSTTSVSDYASEISNISASADIFNSLIGKISHIEGLRSLDALNPETGELYALIQTIEGVKNRIGLDLERFKNVEGCGGTENTRRFITIVTSGFDTVTALTGLAISLYGGVSPTGVCGGALIVVSQILSKGNDAFAIKIQQAKVEEERLKSIFDACRYVERATEGLATFYQNLIDEPKTTQTDALNMDEVDGACQQQTLAGSLLLDEVDGACQQQTLAVPLLLNVFQTQVGLMSRDVTELHSRTEKVSVVADSAQHQPSSYAVISMSNV